jgi:hypothetical protein
MDRIVRLTLSNREPLYGRPSVAAPASFVPTFLKSELFAPQTLLDFPYPPNPPTFL